MIDNPWMIVVFALLAASLIVLLVWLAIRGAEGKGKGAEDRASDMSGRRVIIGLDFSTSMRRKAAAFVNGWELFRSEQLAETDVRFRLYRISSVVDPIGDDLLLPSELPSWTVWRFSEETSRGTALNLFYRRACSKARVWREAGFEGDITIIVFTDGMPDNVDSLRVEEAAERIKLAREEHGVKLRMYAFVRKQTVEQLVNYSLTLNMGCGALSPKNPKEEVIIHQIDQHGGQAVEDSMADASRFLKLPKDVTEHLDQVDLETNQDPPNAVQG